jgi:hypothetical protein
MDLGFDFNKYLEQVRLLETQPDAYFICNSIDVLAELNLKKNPTFYDTFYRAILEIYPSSISDYDIHRVDACNLELYKNFKNPKYQLALEFVMSEIDKMQAGNNVNQKRLGTSKKSVSKFGISEKYSDILLNLFLSQKIFTDENDAKCYVELLVSQNPENTKKQKFMLDCKTKLFAYIFYCLRQTYGIITSWVCFDKYPYLISQSNNVISAANIKSAIQDIESHGLPQGSEEIDIYLKKHLPINISLTK